MKTLIQDKQIKLFDIKRQQQHLNKVKKINTEFQETFTYN